MTGDAAWSVAALAVAAWSGAACGGDEDTCDPADAACHGDPCDVDLDCAADEVCNTPGGGGWCVAASADRPAIDVVAVPAGAFAMGCDPGGPEGCQAFEAPGHEVEVPAFAIDRFEVTAGAYAAFLNLHGDSCGGDGASCVARAAETLPLAEDEATGAWAPKAGKARHPMAVVTWHGATAYCAWRGQALCSEAQWEKAARGTDGRRFPWGDAEPDCEHAHMNTEDWGCGTMDTAEVGGRPAGASPYGVEDMAGNVWEWVADHWHETYDGAPADGSAWTDPPSPWRVIRGGGAQSAQSKYFRPSYRGNGGPDDTGQFRGFRCCQGVTP